MSIKDHSKQQLRLLLLLLFLNTLVLADTGVDDLQITQNFRVSAQVVRGCLLGSGSTDVGNFGTVSFGNISSLDQPINIVSSSNAGSIVIKCTPGIAVIISLDNGVHAPGSISSGRYLLNTATNETLAYQLYQDAAYSVIWGNGGNGGTSQTVTATGAVEAHPVYARLFARSSLPTAGTYTDTVLVTVTY